jgi:hypothetical protein
MPTATRWFWSTGAISVAAGLLLALAAAAVPGGASAQEPGAQNDQDVLWALAGREPFGDVRVAAAFAVVMDAPSAVGSDLPSESRLLYGDVRVRPFLLMSQVSAGMFLASAITPERDGRLLRFGEIRPCRVWTSTAAPGSAIGQETRQAIAERLAARLTAVLQELGVTASPCGDVADATSADLLVWVGEDAAPALATAGPGFLGLVERGEAETVSGATAGETQTETPAALPASGSGGLSSRQAPMRSWAIAAGAVVAALIAGAMSAALRSR